MGLTVKLNNKGDEIYNVAPGKNLVLLRNFFINISEKVIQIEERGCDNYCYDLDQELNLYNFTICLYNEFFVGFNNMCLEKKNVIPDEEFMEKKDKSIFQKLIKMKQIF